MFHRTPHGVTTLALLILLAATTGCLNSHRIKGPVHAAEGPAWVAAATSSGPAPIELTHRLLLIGDAGLYLENDPTLKKLGEWSSDAANSTVLFLGDNIYNEGLVDDDRERGEMILSQQLAATSARKILIPGNHDWGLFKMRESSIENQQAFVAEWRDGKAEFAPRDGCMGPEMLTLNTGSPNRNITLIVLDPSPIVLNNPGLGCAGENDLTAHVAALDALLAEHQDTWTIVASHYPLETGGPHGGLSYGSLIADGILNMIRFWGGSAGDTYDEGYAQWIAATTEVMRKHQPDLYAAGHDHNLQVLSGHDYAGTEVVSGAGAQERVSTVTDLPSTLFAHAAAGFIVIDFGMRDGNNVAVLRVIETEAEDAVFEMDLPASH